MKKEKIKDTTDIKTALKEAKESLLSLRLDLSMGKLKNTKAVFHKRKEIARLLTRKRQEELA